MAVVDLTSMSLCAFAFTYGYNRPKLMKNYSFPRTVEKIQRFPNPMLLIILAVAVATVVATLG